MPPSTPNLRLYIKLAPLPCSVWVSVFVDLGIKSNLLAAVCQGVILFFVKVWLRGDVLKKEPQCFFNFSVKYRVLTKYFFLNTIFNKYYTMT